MWRPRDFPKLNAWVNSNTAALKLVKEASLRERFYCPIVTADKLIHSPLTVCEASRETFSRLLLIRAMRQLALGNIDAAADDLFTCKRLAALITQSGVAMAYIVADEIDAKADRAFQVLFTQKLSDAQVAQLRKSFESIPQLVDVGTIADRFERFSLLELTHDAWRSHSSIGVAEFP